MGAVEAVVVVDAQEVVVVAVASEEACLMMHDYGVLVSISSCSMIPR